MRYESPKILVEDLTEQIETRELIWCVFHC